MHLAADLRHGLGLSPTASASDACFHCTSSVDRSHDHVHTHSHAHTLSVFRPESTMSVRSVSPGPLLSRLARGAGRQRRHKSESPASPSPEPTSSHGRRADSSGYGSTRGSSSSAPSLTWEEFDALPLAIQRKYFSTLERLRFAQDSRVVDGIYQHYDAISAQHWKPRRKPRPHRSASEHLLTSRLRRRSLREITAPVDAADYRFYESLPDKIKKRQFTREEQVLLAGQLRASVILDAADEAIYKLGRRSSVHQLMPSIEINSPSSSHRASMESAVQSRSTVRNSTRSPGRSPRSPTRSPVRSPARSSLRSPGRSVSRTSSHTVHTTATALASATATASSAVPADQSSIVPESFYHSFPWVDEDDDLDLRLFLDDYHANLRDSLPPPPPTASTASSQAKDRQPSFRRQMSVNRKPFSLPLGAPTFPTFSVRPSRPASVSTVKPATAVSTSATSMTSATSPRSPAFAPSLFAQQQSPQSPPLRKSRALSLITPRHTSQSSVSSIDPGAAHYQDPEARLKLRVYLASPQKFDEAIEFGFPSTKTKATSTTTATTRSKKNRKSRLAGLQRSRSDASRALHTFLDDEEEGEEEEEEEEKEEDAIKEDENMEEEEEEESEDVDGASMPDPDSPKTPNLLDSIMHVHGHGHGHGHSHGHNRPAETYAQAPVSSREMTLRMTLTRPDLRACEEDIYGWQQPAQAGGPTGTAQHQRRHSQGTGVGLPGLSPGEDTSTGTGRSSPATFIGPGGRPKESIEQILAGIDHWGPDPSEKGVMKRFWNRMRRS